MDKPRSNQPAAARRRARVLIIEDDTFLAGMYVTKLTLENFDVQLASEGQQGLKLIRETNPDIILLDILLPKMSGFDILKAIKRNPKTKSIPVILLTNLGEKRDVVKGLELGAVDYLIKAHFLPSEVVTKIKRQVRHAPSKAAAEGRGAGLASPAKTA